MVEAAYKASPSWAAHQAELGAPPPRAPDDDPALPTAPYGQRYGQLLRANFRRTLVLQQVGGRRAGDGRVLQLG